ncbi:MFS general substrate transporter [Atractiella rhizophila]|nr:MFS general substrate transporter [Atractiella rhizophila]
MKDTISNLNTASSLESEPNVGGKSSAIGNVEGNMEKRARLSSSTSTTDVEQDVEKAHGAYLDDLVTFDGADDPANPKNWTTARKWTVTMMLGCTTLGATFSASCIAAGVTGVMKEFDIGREVAILIVSFFVFGFILGPILWGPMSETYGRRPAVLLPYIFFIAFTAGTAAAKDLQTVLITRFFAGVAASAPVTNVGGALSDLWEQKTRAIAIVLYSFAVVGGPTFGPIVGAAVSQDSSLGWRWTQWITLILISTIFVVDVFFLPETFAPAILTAKAKRLRLKTKNWALHSAQEMEDHGIAEFFEKTVRRPLEMLVLEPICALVCTYNAFTFGILFLTFEAFPIEFSENRGWNPLEAALPFLAVLAGMLTAGGILIFYNLRFYIPYVSSHGGKAAPERRLPPMMLGGVMFPIAFFYFAWTSNKDIHPANSVVAAYLLGIPFLLVFQSGLNYLIDAYEKYAASAIAANTIMRSITAGVFPIVAAPLFHNLGVDWGTSLLGFISVALACVPFLFYRYGEKIRGMSRFVGNR